MGVSHYNRWRVRRFINKCLDVYTSSSVHCKCMLFFLSLSFNPCSSWVKLGLPLDPSLLSHASQYLCGLVAQFISLVLGEASRINGLLVSMKCTRTTQVSDKNVSLTMCQKLQCDFFMERKLAALQHLHTLYIMWSVTYV